MPFPTSIDSFTTKVDGVTDVLAADTNNLQTAIVAIETKLGITGSGVAGTVDFILNNGLLGKNQTWQSFLGTKTSGTTYTNSSGKPIVVSIRTLSGSNGGVHITVAGSIVAEAFDNTGQVQCFATAIVPDGATYIVTLTGSGSSISRWMELRT